MLAGETPPFYYAIFVCTDCKIKAYNSGWLIIVRKIFNLNDCTSKEPTWNWNVKLGQYIRLDNLNWWIPRRVEWLQMVVWKMFKGQFTQTQMLFDYFLKLSSKQYKTKPKSKQNWQTKPKQTNKTRNKKKKNSTNNKTNQTTHKTNIKVDQTIFFASSFLWNGWSDLQIRLN